MYIHARTTHTTPYKTHYSGNVKAMDNDTSAYMYYKHVANKHTHVCACMYILYTLYKHTRQRESNGQRRHITTPHYYTILLPHIITPHYYPTLPHHITTPHYYTTLLPHITKLHHMTTAATWKQWTTTPAAWPCENGACFTINTSTSSGMLVGLFWCIIRLFWRETVALASQ